MVMHVRYFFHLGFPKSRAMMPLLKITSSDEQPACSLFSPSPFDPDFYISSRFSMMVVACPADKAFLASMLKRSNGKKTIGQGKHQPKNSNYLR